MHSCLIVATCFLMWGDVVKYHVMCLHSLVWSNYSDLTRPISPKWWFSKGMLLISGESRLVKYYFIWPDCSF